MLQPINQQPVQEAEIVSPVPRKNTKETYMSFPEAMAEVIKGKRVTRLEWNSKDEYGLLKDERLMIHTKGADHVWMVSSGDMNAQDWMTLQVLN